MSELGESDVSINSNIGTSGSTSNSIQESEDSCEELELDLGEEPYKDEPIASDCSDQNESSDEEADEDGLTPAILEARFEGTIPVQEWCKCQNCKIDKTDNPLECRCCHEVAHAIGKLVFDGSIDNIKCITEHEDYAALINKTVLIQAAPLLKDQYGRGYRRQKGVSENEFVRAVAYRWILRWICGFIGWDNRRPLPTCIYNNLRVKYPSNHMKGYAASQQRD